MSWFDGMIPDTCDDCFRWDGQKWVQIDSGLCDECEYMLNMFPVLGKDKKNEREKLELLTILDEPEWSLTQKTR